MLSRKTHTNHQPTKVRYIIFARFTFKLYLFIGSFHVEGGFFASKTPLKNIPSSKSSLDDRCSNLGLANISDHCFLFQFGDVCQKKISFETFHNFEYPSKNLTCPPEKGPFHEGMRIVFQASFLRGKLLLYTS